MELIKIYFSNCINILALIFFCGVIMDFLEKISIKYGASIFGKDVIIRGSAYIGTPIHELGHLIFAILFGHTINEVVLFPTKESLAEGKLGYVSHSYKKRNFFQRFGKFFIAIGPMFSGPIVILIIFKLLLPELYNDLYSSIFSIVSEGKDLASGFFSIFSTLSLMFFNLENLANVRFYIFLFLSMNIAGHMGLSTTDIKNCLFSLIFLFIGIILIAFIVPTFPIINKYLIIFNSFLIAIFSIAIVLSLINALLFILLHNLFH